MSDPRIADGVRVAVTGTPGTGKTTAVEAMNTDLAVEHLNDAIGREGLYDKVDEDRDSKVVDLEALSEYVDRRERQAVSEGSAPGVLVESHLTHYLEADRVVVLRCRPETLRDRLESRGESREKAVENAESEAVDRILSETVERHGTESVYEIDTTELTPGDVAREIERVIDGDRDPAVGTVSFVDYLDPEPEAGEIGQESEEGGITRDP